MNKRSLQALLVLPLLLAGCSGGWLGADDEEKLPGKRYSVLHESAMIHEDSSIAAQPVHLPAARSQSRWPQIGGNAFHYVAHPKGPAWSGQWETRSIGEAGDGEGWEMSLVPAPVVAAGKIFAMDAEGRVSAHAVQGEHALLWQSVEEEDVEDTLIPGGGLAYTNGSVIVATGAGRVIAMNEENGEIRWQRNLGLPVRSAPTVATDRIYLTTVDNQLFVLHADDGRLLWKHQGITETAGVMSASAVAVEGPLVVVPYSSGELYALHAGSGREIWREILAGGSQTSGASRLVDLAVPPIIGPQQIYTASRGGMLAALQKRNGLRMWERSLPGVQGMWLSGEFLFVLTGDHQVVALLAKDGRVRWSAPLEDDKFKQENGAWFGPMLISGKLVFIGSEGNLVLLSPLDGSRAAWDDELPDGINHPPAVAQDALYAVSRDATLYKIQ